MYTCKPLDKCETAIQDIKENVAYPSICSIRGKMPVVCCPPVSISKSKDRTTVNDLKNTNDIPPEILCEYNLFILLIIIYYITHIMYTAEF